MWWYYIKIAIRNLFRNKTITIINLSGLAIGIACCFVISMYVQNELRFDKYIPDGNRVYRVFAKFRGGGTQSGMRNMFYHYIAGVIPEVQKSTIIYAYGVQVAYGDKVFKETRFCYTDSSVFDIFGWKVTMGNKDTFLDNPYSIVISESIAKKYFDTICPLGKTLKLDNKVNYTVTGVFQDVPRTSHLQVELLVPFESCRKLHPQYYDWIVGGSFFYLKLFKDANPAKVELSLNNIWRTTKTVNPYYNENIQLKLQPVRDVYLNSNTGQSDFLLSGQVLFIYIFSIIGFLILLLACFNYLNLAIAQLHLRWVEIGIRKIGGAMKRQIIQQFLLENFLIVVLAIFLAIILASIALPWINGLTAKVLLMSDFVCELIAVAIIVCLFTVLGTGLYPVLVLAGGQPVAILKGNFYGSFKKIQFQGLLAKGLRESLITFQFFTVITLGICAIVITKQVNFLNNIDLGYNSDQLLIVKNPWDTLQFKRYQKAKEDFKRMPEVAMVTSGYDVPMQGTNNFCDLYEVNSPQNICNAGMASVDFDYLTCIGATFVDGRNFSHSLDHDSLSVIISELAATQLELKDPIGALVSGLWDNRVRRVVGVVKDMSFNDLYQPNFPMVFELCQTRRPYYSKLVLRLKTNDYKPVVGKIEKYWRKNFPGIAFVHFTIDEVRDVNYAKERRTQRLMYIFTGIALLLCIMGLIALVMVGVQRRTKEIGVRKVNGGTTLSIIGILWKEQLIRVLLAFVFACPVAYYFMKQWLHSFAYQTPLSWWVFVSAGAVTMLVAMVIVTVQSLRAIQRNPVDALRYE
jgi:putative ABC transport system permease protein